MKALFHVKRYITLSQNPHICSFCVMCSDTFFRNCSYNFPIFACLTLPRKEILLKLYLMSGFKSD